MSYLQSQPTPSLGGNTPSQLLVSAPFSSPTPWVSVRVNVIALSRKGLASHNAKNKFPPTARALPHTCLLLPGPSFILEGYFVLSTALSSITKWSHTFLSLYCMVVCRYTCRNTREYKLYFIDRLIQNLFIYQWHKSQKNQIFFSPWMQTALLPLNPPAVPRRGSGQAGTFCWVFLILQATKTVHWGGGFWFCMFHYKKDNLPQRQTFLYLSMSKGKSCKGVQGLFLEDKTQGSCVFKNQV